MKLVVTVEDHKAAFLLELLKQADDFISVEVLEESSGKEAFAKKINAEEEAFQATSYDQTDPQGMFINSKIIIPPPIFP